MIAFFGRVSNAIVTVLWHSDRAYLREEVQAEALVRDIGGYSRLLDLVAASSGRVVNLHSLSRDVGVSYETARRYLDVLEDTLILFRIPAWSGSDRASLVAHPKILLFDLGVRNAILRRPLDRPLEDERGCSSKTWSAWSCAGAKAPSGPRRVFCIWRSRSQRLRSLHRPHRQGCTKNCGVSGRTAATDKWRRRRASRGVSF